MYLVQTNYYNFYKKTKISINSITNSLIVLKLFVIDTLYVLLLKSYIRSHSRPSNFKSCHVLNNFSLGYAIEFRVNLCFVIFIFIFVLAIKRQVKNTLRLDFIACAIYTAQYIYNVFILFLTDETKSVTPFVVHDIIIIQNENLK